MEPPREAVTRGALERVLARAAELQAAAGDDTEPPDGLTEEQIVDLGKEVGLSAAHVRQALAEERARIAPATDSPSGIGTRFFGATRVSAQRVVPGSATRVLATLDRWMQREESLRVVRQRPDRIIWEPRRGLIGSVRQLLRGRDSALYRANAIAATVVRIDAERTLASLEADFTVLRRAMAGQVGGGALIGGASTVALMVMGVMLPVAVAPVFVVTGAFYAGSRRAQRHVLERAQLSLEFLLDRLERGETQAPSLLGLIETALPPGR